MAVLSSNLYRALPPRPRKRWLADEKFIMSSFRQAFPNWPKYLRNRSNFHFKEQFKVPTEFSGPLISSANCRWALKTAFFFFPPLAN